MAIEGFKSGEYEILVATDIAGRGIDIQVSGVRVGGVRASGVRASGVRVGGVRVSWVRVSWVSKLDRCGVVSRLALCRSVLRGAWR